MSDSKRIFIRQFGSGGSKIEIDLKEIPTNILLEEVNARFGSNLEMQGLILLLERLGLNPSALSLMFSKEELQRESNQ